MPPPRCQLSVGRPLWRGAWLGPWLLAAALSAAEPARPARVGTLTDNYPFSYQEKDGRITGFAYDLISEIEDVMALRLERVVGVTKDINQAFREGRIDIQQSYAHFPEREGEADFSVPYLTLSGAIIVQESNRTITGLADLRGKRVLVHRSSMGEMVLRKAGLDDSVVYAESVEDALRKVDRGEADATLATRLTALSRAHHFGFKNIRAVDTPVEGFDVRYCIAVREGDRELLAKINEGLAILVRTGRYDALYRKWFSHLEPKSYTIEQVLLAVAAGLAIALAVALWAAVRQRRLRRRIAQQAADLRASEERYRSLFEGDPDGLLVLGTVAETGEVLVEQTNPAARRLLQTGSGPAPGARLSHVLAGDRALLSRLMAAVREDRLVEFEHERPAGGGWWRVTLNPLGGRGLVALRDITEPTRSRQRLQQQEEHLRRSQKIEALGTLAGGIAHDFNNLLTAIMGNTQITLLNLPPGHPETGSLEQVLKAARRAQQLVKQILAFSRRSEASRHAVRTSPLVEEVIGFLRAVARGTVEFEHRGDAAATVLADPAQVHQVLMNIGTNALQAMRGTPGRLVFVEEQVRLEAGSLPQPGLPPGPYVRITVRDTGPGMSRELQERIFEPFFTTKPPGEGTGLGLSVVHGIMQQHEGAVTVESEPGRGTGFHLYFPAAGREVAVPSNGTAPAAPGGAGQRVLLVEDDAAILETVRRILVRLGYTVSAHPRADDALAEFEAAPDRLALALTDLSMPGMNGLQFAARVRQRRPGLPLLIASGFWSEPDQAEARHLQVTAMLHKPLTYEMLAAMLAAHLPRG